MNTNTNGITVSLGDTDVGQKIQQNLTNEDTLKAFNNILNRIDTLEKAVLNLTTILERGPGLVSMTMDMADEGIKNAAKNGVYVEKRLGAALELAEKLTAPAMVEQLHGLLDLSHQAPGLIAMTMDTLDEEYRKASQNINIPAVTSFLGNTAKALSEATTANPKKVGAFGLLRALNDPDRQKALGFLMELTKRLGQQM